MNSLHIPFPLFLPFRFLSLMVKNFFFEIMSKVFAAVNSNPGKCMQRFYVKKVLNKTTQLSKLMNLKTGLITL